MRIRKNADDSIDFLRADGRMIPRGGYRYEDMHDDYDVVSAAPECSTNPSAEGFSIGIRDEVREPRAAYRSAS